MYRWQKNIEARVLTDYVHETQERYRTILQDLEQRITPLENMELKSKAQRMELQGLQ